MSEEERQHRQRMLDFAKNQKDRPPLTPEELAEAIKELKRKYPQDFPQNVR